MIIGDWHKLYIGGYRLLRLKINKLFLLFSINENYYFQDKIESHKDPILNFTHFNDY